MDTAGLTHEFKEYHKREIVPDRCLHIDGDFLAYYASSGDSSESLESMLRTVEVMTEDLRAAAGAEKTLLHLTGKDSDKGNRYNIARLKRYQENRAGKPKPINLSKIKQAMESDLGAVTWCSLEADDGLAMSQWQAIDDGTPELSVIASGDKDLNTVPGLHLGWRSLQLYTVPFEGYLILDRTKKSPKLTGAGWKFFCAQLLMGDSADNISGLPKYKGPNGYKSCGPVAAFELLKDSTSPEDCITRVLNEYRKYSEDIGFRDYTGNPLTLAEAFTSEAKLLWMRRTPDENDIINLLRDMKNGTKIHQPCDYGSLV